MSFIFEKLTQSLAANQRWQLGIAANEARIVASNYPVGIELRRGGQVIGTATGVLAGDYVRGIDFDTVTIVNGAIAQEVKLSLASGQAGSDRITGEVSVISGEVMRVKSGIAFIGSGNSDALAANYSFIQLWNPLLSGKNVIVNQMVLTATGSGVIVVNHAVEVLGSVSAGANQPKNKLLGGALSVAEIRDGAAGTVSGDRFLGLMIGINSGFVFPIVEPLILSPGGGIVVRGGAVNEQVRATFQFWEESI